MAYPISPTVLPGRTCSIPFHIHSCATLHKWRASGDTAPTLYIREVSAMKPCFLTVKSRLIISPSLRTSSFEGTPWQITLLIELLRANLKSYWPIEDGMALYL